MLEIMPVWAWIVLCLAVMAVAAVLVVLYAKRLERFVLSSAQEVSDVLRVLDQSPENVRAWTEARLMEVEAKCKSLMDKSEELYSHTRADVEEAWRRVGMILAEKRSR